MARRRSFGFPLAAALAALTVSFAGATLAHGLDRPSGAAPPGMGHSRHRLCRGARRTRAQRPHRGAHAHDGRPRPGPRAGERARRPTSGNRATGRIVRNVQSGSLAAASAVAARRLRFRARHVFFRARRLRLRARRDQDRGAAGSERRRMAALHRGRRDDARRHRPAHPHRHSRRRGRHRLCGHHRQARRGFARGERRFLRLQPRPRAGDCRVSYGGGDRDHILFRSRRACFDPLAGKPSADQEMGRRDRVARRSLLSGALRSRNSHPACLRHGRHRAHWRDGRSADADFPGIEYRRLRGPSLWRRRLYRRRASSCRLRQRSL